MPRRPGGGSIDHGTEPERSGPVLSIRATLRGAYADPLDSGPSQSNIRIVKRQFATGRKHLKLRTGPVAGLVAAALVAGAVLAGCARHEAAPAASPVVTAPAAGGTSGANAASTADPAASAFAGVDDLIKSIDASISGSDAGTSGGE
jgi:hypothetical protein